VPQFRTSHLVIGFTILAIVVVWGVFTFEMWNQRRDNIEQVNVTNERLVHVLEAHLQRTIEMVNLVLDQTEHYALNEAIGLPPLDSEGSQLLDKAVKNSPHIAGLAIVGADGIANQGIEVFADGVSKTMSKRFDARDRQYFSVFKEAPKRAVFIGKPIKTKTSDRWVVPISRSVLGGDDEFKGVNIAIVRLETFSDIFESVRPKDSFLTVYLDDGSVFVRSPYIPADPLIDAGKLGPQILASAPRPLGTINDAMINGGRSGVISYRFASNWPFIIVLETPMETILEKWRLGAQREVFIGFLATLVFGSLSFILIGQLSRREQAESELRKRSSAIEQSPNMILISNLEGTIEYVNPKFTELTGYSLEESVGMKPSALRSGDTPAEVYAELWETILSGEEWRGNLKIRHKNGEVFWAATAITPVRDENDRVTHFVSMHEDITERKRAESHIRLAKEQAEVANRAKSDLMANMSHELRTPLNAIIGFSETMKHETFGPVGSDKNREYLEDIHHSGQHLLELINDILDVSAIEAGALELHEENVSLIEVVEVSGRLIKPRAEAGRVSVTSSIDLKTPMIYADARRVKQVFLNLLSNSVKFTPEGGEVTVSAWLNDNGSLAVAVADNGMGMDEEEITKALSTFGQVDSGLDRKHEGTGLGLPLTKGLMELHGGTLKIKSDKGDGSLITVTFPKERVI